MKKICLMLLMIISGAITIYTIGFWQPTEDVALESSINTKVVAEKNYEKGESNKKENTIANKKVDNNLDTEISKVESEEDMVVQASILKVEEEEIKKCISRENKERVKSIIKKLSAVDVINIKDSFNNENNQVGFKEAFNLIKIRVSEKDYEEIKEILSEYIDFDLLEVEV